MKAERQTQNLSLVARMLGSVTDAGKEVW